MPEKLALQIGARQFQISRNLGKDANQSTKSKLFVRGNCNVMLSATDGGGETNMAAHLPSGLISVGTKELGKFWAAEVARQFKR